MRYHAPESSDVTGSMTAQEATPFGARLRAYREQRGLSQEELAARAGLAVSAISALERGVRRRPYPTTVRLIAEALELSAEDRAAFGRAVPPASSTPAVDARSRPLTTLPVPRTPLIGRARERAALPELVRQHGGRLVTLTGVGGAGKTRLALQVAADLAGAFPDGVCLVELAPIRDAALVPQAVAVALGVQESPGTPLQETLAAVLRSQALLLVLDNCEHLIDACAELAERLLSGCPDLRILATSREPLQIAGERPWRVPPLAVPRADGVASLDEIAGCPAVQLFLERAQSIDAAFELTAENATAIAQVCIRLDGIPLALELAAARVQVLTVAQILERLDDSLRLLTGGARAAPTRQQTLRAALDWSYDLLTEPEQAVLRRLTVFAGGCDFEAAEAVAGSTASGLELIDVLGRLVDKSLLLAADVDGTARYHLLEPVRQYGEQHLRASGEFQITRSRHAGHFADLAEQALPELRGPAQVAWLRRLDREHDNLRAALRWALEHGDPDAALRLSVALVPFWDGRGHLGEGRRWLHAALDAPQASTASAALRTRALLGAGALAEWQGDLDAAEPLLDQCLTLARAQDDRPSVAWSIAWLGVMHVSRGDVARAVPLFEESLELFRSLHDEPGIAFVLLDLGIAVAYQGDTARACLLLEESLQLFRALGDTRYVAIANTMLGYTVSFLGDAARAAALCAEGLRGHWEVGDRTYLAYSLVVIAGVLNRLRQPVRAVRLLGAAEALSEAVVGPLASSTFAHRERLVAALRRRLDETEFEPAWAAGRGMTLDEAVAEALTDAPLAPPPTPPSRPDQPRNLLEPLTAREREVARLVAQGYTDRQIAEALTVALSTVGTHVHHVLAKLGVRSRRQVSDLVLGADPSATQPD
jgi:predicted ATPase/DNA-binding CsgD family transcriptional regulator/transcriptional regulator with XRE-family HTH domain